ncbi:uncharacterized protein LOC122040660 isoform X2 [Zingiber officinale]|uniref:uncharacterized protein LOC122040660 isoform X2 n=1 Tax=Zingiber officinale TaxID=94328 RepID=UPI001C4C6AA0|nr:uncharacterized protein LOC122040660 isoform X2 [Zingiber officinale]
MSLTIRSTREAERRWVLLPATISHLSSNLLSRFLVFCCLVFLRFGDGFYLPGSYPDEYPVGVLERSCRLPVKVNSLTSIETELPFSYYNLPFCRPQDGIKDNTKNLGELLMRDGSKKGWTDNPVLDPSLVLCTDDLTLQVLTLRIWILGVPLCILPLIFHLIHTCRRASLAQVDIPHDPYLSENISSWDVEVVLLQKSKAIISSK